MKIFVQCVENIVRYQSHVSFLIINHQFDQNSIYSSENSSNFIINENIDNLGISAQQSFTKQWLNNTSFNDPIQPTWYPNYGELGDITDVKAINSSGQVNYVIIGNSSVKRIDEELSYTYWDNSSNPLLPSHEIYTVAASAFKPSFVHILLVALPLRICLLVAVVEGLLRRSLHGSIQLAQALQVCMA